MGLGTTELIIIFVVALIFFGPRKLPELGRSLGKALGEFKRTSNELRNTLDDEIRAEERRTSAAPVIAPAHLDTAATPDPDGMSDYPDYADPTDAFVTDTVARDGQSAETKPAGVS